MNKAVAGDESDSGYDPLPVTPRKEQNRLPLWWFGARASRGLKADRRIRRVAIEEIGGCYRKVLPRSTMSSLKSGG